MDLTEPPTCDNLPVYYAGAASSDISKIQNQCHVCAVVLGLLKAGLGGPSREYSAIRLFNYLSAGQFPDTRDSQKCFHAERLGSAMHVPIVSKISGIWGNIPKINVSDVVFCRWFPGTNPRINPSGINVCDSQEPLLL